MAALLEIESLDVRYGHHLAVENLNLSVDSGQVAVLFGPNGAGKSSTLNAICGAVRPKRGRIRFAGQDITGLPMHRIVQLGLVQVPEGRRIIGRLTVRENLLLGAYSEPSRAKRMSLLGMVEAMFPILVERSDAPAGVLSGGEQQMLAFGRALMASPRMLLLDEPSMGLAPIITDQIVAKVKAIAESGIPILMVEQNAKAVAALATHTYFIEHGVIVGAETRANARSALAMESVLLGLPQAAA
ncbi:ABC transporter ATP-binding protein [Ramlibacter sp.]|uniref:ABC transporter ATP-binding protein n=1 Tax=Ramlibacter sp. TaxID=1917967 RepID=UPI003D14F41D